MGQSLEEQIQKRANKIGSRPYNKGGVTMIQAIQIKAFHALLSKPTYTYSIVTIIEDTRRLSHAMLYAMAKEEILLELENNGPIVPQ